MWRGVCGGMSAAVLAVAVGSGLPVHAQDNALPYDWTGFYVGINAGGAHGTYNPTTSTVVSPTYLFKPVDVAAVNNAGMQHIKPLGFLGGVQAGYNWQFGHAVVGLESDLDYFHLNGAANSGAVRYPGGGSGFFIGARLTQFVISSYANADWLFTLRPRVGIAADNWLFYATGGLALTRLQGGFLFTDYNFNQEFEGAEQAAAINSIRAGYIVGGGVETAVTDRLRLKAEYGYVNFGTVHAKETDSDFQTAFAPPATQTFTQSMKLTTQFVRVGLNYSFGTPGQAPPETPSWLTKLLARADDSGKSNWEFDVGTRVWFSSGTVGAPDPLLDLPPNPSLINSRLTYENVHAWTGETFARLDHASGFFSKGFLGAGGMTNGVLIDEDFPGFGGAYSNTVSYAKGGHLGYATIDLGYSFLRAPGAKVGAFVGYNYYAQHVNTFDCIQVAGDNGTCPPPADPNFLGLAEDERYDSLRIGLSAQFMLSNKLKFTTDVAYLPWVKFRGQDDHNWREVLLPESGNKGDGVMLESTLDYAVTPNWNVGIGGRFWAWNMHDDAYVTFDFLGSASPPTTQLARYNTERFGIFLQSDYHWGDTTPLLASADEAALPPMDWRGFYIGGHGGGARSHDVWSDPFGATMSAGLVNVPGFGDTIHGTGPLGGGQAGLNWQTGHWVYGLQADWSAADLRGENTCFSGLGGLNCQHVIRSIATGAARIGYAWDRALVYAKGGGAETKIDYILQGNTSGISRGYEVTGVRAWGWTAGGGLEYALTDHWTTMCEFDHIDLGNISVPFPNVLRVRTQNIHVRQSIDEIKLGVNYKFDWTTLAAAK